VTIQEINQGDGAWSLTLKDGTPGNITDLLASGFSYVRVFATSVQSVEVTDLPPMYTGVVLRRDGQYGCSGVGPNWLLGEPNATGDQVGPIFETAVSFNSTTGTLTAWTQAVADRCGLGYGTIGATATKWAGELQYVAPRVVLDPWMVAGFGGTLEYRVDPSLNLNCAFRSELYKNPTDNDITAILINGEVVSRTLVDPDGVPCPEMELSSSVEELERRVVLKGASSTAGSSAAGWNYKNPAGGTLDRIRYTINEQVASGDMTGALARLLGLHRYKRQSLSVRVSSRPPFPFICGDWVWVFDPLKGLHDTSQNGFTYAGQHVFPVATRVVEMTYPIVEGMSVWHDDTHQGGVLTDLTPYVEWETGDTTLSVGALPRTLSYLRRPAS
jgi:hypothetical protein